MSSPTSSEEDAELLSENGWLEAAIAWNVCASIHETFAKRKDAFYTTRQKDYVAHAKAARKKACAALNEAKAMNPSARPQMTDEEDAELSAALGWPGGISDPILDRAALLRLVATATVELASMRRCFEAADRERSDLRARAERAEDDAALWEERAQHLGWRPIDPARR